MDYLDINVLKSLHIIFVVSWFAGLFYIVRLFIYHTEAQTRTKEEAALLSSQFEIMEWRLWYIITTPAMVLTILFGTLMILKYPDLYFFGEHARWMHIKLGDWQGGGYAAGYAQGRVPSQGRMSRHYQVESLMSLSGANADYRLPATNAEQKRILAALFSGLSGTSLAVELTEAQQKMVDAMVSDLRKVGSAGVIVSGLEDG